ncbi:AGE family epimerase/isomerase [Devosia sp.]|uniref:AGE family epimerase/isomerase n=1 Tax=Devosia sp. TaxID=1871048 RepID=UPI001B157C71|nr:AGE family epimerase/isomerase [Devosia sp.]MBO9590905.1 AGE family epimerase/isomerase [Devosia sp.]
MTDYPDFRSRAFLLDQIKSAIDFFYPANFDASGGFFNEVDNTGTVVDPAPRSLVHTCRSLFNHATAYRLFGRAENRDAVRHALDFLTGVHRVPETRAYIFGLDFSQGVATPTVTDNITYGYSFVVLAYATALKAGFAEARFWLDEVFETMERHLYEPAYGLYADQASADWSEIRPYRGQNGNMHACEAMLVAYEATDEQRYLHRAETLAAAMTLRQATLSPIGQLWEHYKTDWAFDPDYNFNDHSDAYRPWGYLTGHQTEWAKLLLILDGHLPRPWHRERAKQLFDEGVACAWDEKRGGLQYSYGHDKAVYDDSKQQWVHAESLGAAAHLALATGEQHYWDWYDRLWRYTHDHLIDHERGGWFRALDADNRVASDRRGAPEPDYHNIGACAEILAVLERTSA